MTTDGHQVTCNGCRTTRLFQQSFPTLQAPKKRGRKSLEGRVECHSKFFLEPSVHQQWQAESNKAAVIAEALKHYYESKK